MQPQHYGEHKHHEQEHWECFHRDHLLFEVNRERSS
jgi:hypothetical protein